MKENFQKSLDQLIENLQKEGRTPSLLLHSCCGPCSSYCLEYLRGHFDVTVFYYNPNIYPKEEYDLRLSEQTRLINEMNKNLAGKNQRKIKLISVPYDHEEFLKKIKGLEKEPEGGSRCERCFVLRLQLTAELALKSDFEYFGTTLTVSPHKNAQLINSIGSDFQNAYTTAGPIWLPSDFKKKEGYKRSIELSKQYNLYRQNFCGCEFSKLESN